MVTTDKATAADATKKGIFSAVTANSTNGAIKTSWTCTNDMVADPDGSADATKWTDKTDLKASNKSVTTTCVRLLPKDTTTLNTSDDIRFDGGKDSKFSGAMFSFKRNDKLKATLVTALTGAFQAATVAGAVAVAALTF